jgi:hypothetical protein
MTPFFSRYQQQENAGPRSRSAWPLAFQIPRVVSYDWPFLKPNETSLELLNRQLV